MVWHGHTSRSDLRIVRLAHGFARPLPVLREAGSGARVPQLPGGPGPTLEDRPGIAGLAVPVRRRPLVVVCAPLSRAPTTPSIPEAISAGAQHKALVVVGV